ncbi:hypothetical protein ACFU99_16970 [Streptomyces sp. NPDC057654]|uniref:hypothetical protein n=1 Tax=Streptomyces sp. NPDC057654 TaxID=3346196 RepID=UPI0036B4B782
MEALYAVAYTLEFAATRSAPSSDFVVAPLEGLWWADNPEAFASGAKGTWDWTMLISMPSWITEEMIEETIEEARQTGLAKKKLTVISHRSSPSAGNG